VSGHFYSRDISRLETKRRCRKSYLQQIGQLDANERSSFQKISGSQEERIGYVRLQEFGRDLVERVEFPGDKMSGVTGMQIIENRKMALRWSWDSVRLLNSCMSKTLNSTKLLRNFPLLMAGIRTPLQV
jgi:hypothetical protein